MDILRNQLINSFIVQSYTEVCANNINLVYENPFIINKKEMIQNLIEENFLIIYEEIRKKAIVDWQNSLITTLQGEKDEIQQP